MATCINVKRGIEMQNAHFTFAKTFANQMPVGRRRTYAFGHVKLALMVCVDCVRLEWRQRMASRRKW